MQSFPENKIRHWLMPHRHVLVGVSGGPDSMALLHYLYAKREDFGIAVAAMHCHHGLRPSADAEMAMVVAYCQEHGIPCTCERLDVHGYVDSHRCGVEEAGHELRHAALSNEADRIGADCIALAHHAEDRAETLLLHLVRGSGLQGLAAMPAEVGRILRPFIEQDKQALIAYCDAHAIPYVIDESNSDLAFTRNRVRHELMPLLATYNPQIITALNRTAEACTLDNDALQQQAAAAYAQMLIAAESMQIVLRARILRDTSWAIGRRVLQMAVDALGGGTISATQAGKLQELLYKKYPTCYDIGNGLRLCFTTNAVYCTRLNCRSGYDHLWDGQVPLLLPLGTMVARPSPCERNAHTLFLPAPRVLRVRTRQPGDHLRLKHLGEKSVKKLMQERKIPQHLRAVWPLVCDPTGQILWIPGLAYAEEVLCVQQTENPGICIQIVDFKGVLT